VGRVRQALGWRSVEDCVRLEGFTAQWERALAGGRELSGGSTLEQAGLADGGSLAVVRIELVAQGWKIEDADDTDSEEEEAAGASAPPAPAAVKA